jgi:hypothetical protein
VLAAAATVPAVPVVPEDAAQDAEKDELAPRIPAKNAKKRQVVLGVRIKERIAGLTW